jgi:SAM-dependent methyltransferase
VYDALAPLYDRIMAHVQYHQWAFLIEKTISQFSKTERPVILEIGCGTGVLASKLPTNDYTFLGSDLSFKMCRQARSRIPLLFCADGRALPLRKPVDLILFLYDGINYLPTLADYAALFREIHRCLTPQGLFLFDITTEHNSCTFFLDNLDYEDFGSTFYLRHSYYERAALLQHNDFTIFVEADSQPGLFSRSVERHRQKVFPVAAVADTVPRELFELLGTWDGFTFKKYSRRSERVHFLVRKRAGT